MNEPSIPKSQPGRFHVEHSDSPVPLPEAEEGDITLNGTYTASNGMQIPINLLTNKSGIIHRLYMEELQRRAGTKNLPDDNVSHLLSPSPPPVSRVADAQGPPVLKIKD